MDIITSYFAQQGVLGIIILATIGVIVWQQKRIDAKDKQIETLNNQRVADTNAYTSSYTATIKEVVTAQKDALAASNLLQRSIDALATALQTLVSNTK